MTDGSGDEDRHAHVRFFKMLEVAYNCAKNDHYERAAALATQAAEHYDETDIDGNPSRAKYSDQINGDSEA